MVRMIIITQINDRVVQVYSKDVAVVVGSRCGDDNHDIDGRVCSSIPRIRMVAGSYVKMMW